MADSAGDIAGQSSKGQSEEKSKKKGQKPSTKIGAKINCADPDSAAEKAELERRLDLWSEAVSEPTTLKPNGYSEAVWDPDTGLARVTKQSGKYWDCMGHVKQSHLYLRREEALFLVDVAKLSLTLADNEKALTSEEAYRVLLPKRKDFLRYRVYSQLKLLGYKVVEHQGNMDFSSILKAERKRKREASLKSENGKKVKDEDVVTVSDGEDVTVLEDDEEPVTIEDESTNDSSVVSEASQDDLPLDEGPLAPLWSGKTVPLLEPRFARSTSEIMRRQQFPPAAEKNRGEDHERHGFKIDFDLYLPTVVYKKSAPRLPNYRICVTSQGDAMPEDEDVDDLVKDLKDSVPLLFAVVATGSISFYCFSKVELPQIVTMG